jgi:ABC-type polar amino acid transport system ATPase subunit
MVIIETKNIKKSFGDLEVLHDINVSVNKGEVVCLIGASGSGKSTLLRCINLLETPTSGHVLFNDNDITNENVDINAIRQQIGMVFQSFNLFENLNVEETLIDKLQLTNPSLTMFLIFPVTVNEPVIIVLPLTSKVAFGVAVLPKAT